MFQEEAIIISDCEILKDYFFSFSAFKLTGFFPPKQKETILFSWLRVLFNKM